MTTYDIIGRKSPKNPNPPSFGTFLWGDPLRIFDDSYLARNQNHGAIRRWTFHDPAFVLLGTIPACDGRPDGRTDGQTEYTQSDRHVAVAGLCV